MSFFESRQTRIEELQGQLALLRSVNVVAYDYRALLVEIQKDLAGLSSMASDAAKDDDQITKVARHLADASSEVMKAKRLLRR